jgi:hypothetical protein
MSKSEIKTRLITFLDTKCTVHFKFIPQRVNQGYYVEVLKRLREAVCRKRPEVLPNDWIFHHESAPAHRALSVTQFLTQKSIPQIQHPHYSSDLAPNDFWLFTKIKSELKGRRFQDSEGIQRRKIMTTLKAIPQQQFQKCFQQWQHRWTKRVTAQGEYIEGESSQ